MLENEIRAEMVRLLRYANRQKVGAALGVSRASVSDWAAGRHVTPARLAQVRALFDAPDTTKEPPPDWAGVLMTRDELKAYADAAKDEVLNAIAAGRSDLIEAIAQGVAELIEQRLDEENDDEGRDGTPDQPPGTQEPPPAPEP